MSKFIEDIYKTIVENNIEIYKRLFNETEITDNTIEYWINSLEFYRGLDELKKDIFFIILKQIIIDTISNLFGLLDGSSELIDEDYTVSVLIDGIVEDSLQDEFLEFIEEM